MRKDGPLTAAMARGVIFIWPAMRLLSRAPLEGPKENRYTAYIEAAIQPPLDAVVGLLFRRMGAAMNGVPVTKPFGIKLAGAVHVDDDIARTGEARVKAPEPFAIPFGLPAPPWKTRTTG